MNITDVCIRRPVLAWMLIAATVEFGLVAATRNGISQYPDVDFPTITVSLKWEGAAPEVVENEITEVLEDLKAGKMIVLVDDEDRENEGDLVLPAEKVTPEAINFIVKQARGVVCLALTAERCDRLQLRAQSDVNTAQLGTAWLISRLGLGSDPMQAKTED